jgi:hypothetical protein
LRVSLRLPPLLPPPLLPSLSVPVPVLATQTRRGCGPLRCGFVKRRAFAPGVCVPMLSASAFSSS